MYGPNLNKKKLIEGVHNNYKNLLLITGYIMVDLLGLHFYHVKSTFIDTT